MELLELQAKWDDETLALMQQALLTVPQKADRVLRDKVRPYATRRVNATLRKAPPAHQWSSEKPPPWTSPKQRRAYWATDGFGQGIPTQRTGKHIKSWSVRANYKSDFGLLIISSNDPRGAFITGIYQQLFHALAKWAYAPDLIQDQIFVEAEFVFVEGLLDILWKGIF